MKIKHSIILTCFIGIIVLFFPLISQGAAVCQGNCIPDGCNKKCPAGCTSTQDPDCGCQPDGCCGIGCDRARDADCSTSVCTNYSKCSTTGSKLAPWYCDSTGTLIENCHECFCTGDWTCGPAGTSCFACVEAWSCEAWSDCVGGNQTQDCTDANSCVAAVNKPVSGRPCDSTSPVVTFTLPLIASSLTISFTVSAYDAVGVTGYLITESSDIPLLSAGWTETVPTSHTFNADGLKTLHAWAKDLAGNVSIIKSASVTITLPVADTTAPVVTFTLPSTASSRTVSFTVSAFDAVGVTSYLITESSDIPPLSAGWIGTAPTPGTFTATGQKIFTADGSKTLYVWAKDAAGNVSLSKSASVIVDATAPLVTFFSAAANQALVTADYTVTDNFALQRVELWRATYDAVSCGETVKTGCAWSQIKAKDITGVSQSGNFTDSPAIGSYWYGIHAIDQVGNMGREPNPIKIIIAAACPPESDAKFCSNLGKNCGSVTADNNCLVSHTVADCSLGMGCTLPTTCGVNNVCACSPVCPLPSEVCAGVTDTRANGCNNGNCSVDGIKTGCPDIVVLNPADDETLLAGSSLTFRVFINPLITASVENRWIRIGVNKLKVGTTAKTDMSYDDKTVFSVNLYDDGSHGDGAANDNVWSATWQAIEEPTVSGSAASLVYHYVYISVGRQNPSSILRWFKIAAKPACVAVLNPEETDNGDSSQRIDVVYLSADDGDPDHLKADSDFAADALDFKNKLLTYEPFLTKKDKMNFWRVDTPMNCIVGQKVDTINSTPSETKYIYNAGCANCIECNAAAVRSYAMNCSNDFIGVIINTKTYAGEAFPSYYASYNGTYIPSRERVPNDAYSGLTVSVHEFGHHFGKLLDEYNKYKPYKDYIGGSDWLYNCNSFFANPTNDKCPVNFDISLLRSTRNCDTSYTFAGSCGNLGSAYCKICTYTDWYRPVLSDSIMLDQKGVFDPVSQERLNKMFDILLP